MNNLGKKIFIVVLIALMFMSSTPFSIQCYKCKKDGVRSVANRSFADEQGNNKGYSVYRCYYGHILKIDDKTGERK